MKKNIKNPKYLFFILKNKLFETLAFLPYILGVGYMATIGGKRICTAHEKFINNAYK